MLPCRFGDVIEEEKHCIHNLFFDNEVSNANYKTIQLYPI